MSDIFYFCLLEVNSLLYLSPACHEMMLLVQQNTWCAVLWARYNTVECMACYFIPRRRTPITLQWRHNEHDGISNYRRLHCLLNCLFRRRSMKKQSSASLAFVRGIHRWPVGSPHKWPVTRKMFPFDDVIILNPDWIVYLIQFTFHGNMIYYIDAYWQMHVSKMGDHWFT